MRGLSGVLSILLSAAAAAGQSRLDPERPQHKMMIQVIEQRLDNPLPTSVLKCDVTKLKPALNFAFRYHSGFRVDVPLKQFPKGRAMMAISFRVKPEAPGAEPAYFLQIYRLPKLPPQAVGPKSKFLGTVQGGFYLGEGNYKVDWTLEDEEGRMCTAQWRLEHNPKGSERFREVLGPGEVSDLSVDRFDGIEDGKRPYRVAVLLHASPQYPRSSVLSGFDISMLLSSLASLYENTSLSQTSVSVFSLQHQKEIFRAGEMTRKTYRDLARALRGIENSTIDIGSLRNPRGQAEMLARLVNRELAAKDPADAIILMGPNSYQSARLAAGMIEKVKGGPPVFYVRHDLYPFLFPFRDTVEEVTRAAGGRLFTVRSPQDLAKAIDKITESLPPRQSQPGGGDSHPASR